MTIKHVSKESLHGWVDGMVADTRVYGVKAKAERFAFAPLRRAADLRLDYDVTILPPKKYFQPEREVLLTFRDGRFETVTGGAPFVLFGVHPYDMVAISQMDQVFTRKQCDTHYVARRELATIVVVDVQTPSENVFAGCTGFATAEGRTGMDVYLTRLDDDTFLVESCSAKGATLMAPLSSAADADAGALAARDALRTANRERLRRHVLKVKTDALPALLEQGVDNPVWEEKARLCYSCGSCTLVCPTCYCFDVHDEIDWDLKGGRRVREWDGCMLPGFAEVAGGHNFRGNRAARYRHRYYRKGKYVPEMIGEVSCVGCGRCISACTAKIANPVEVFNRLMQEA